MENSNLMLITESQQILTHSKQFSNQNIYLLSFVLSHFINRIANSDLYQIGAAPRKLVLIYHLIVLVLDWMTPCSLSSGDGMRPLIAALSKAGQAKAVKNTTKRIGRCSSSSQGDRSSPSKKNGRPDRAPSCRESTASSRTRTLSGWN